MHVRTEILPKHALASVFGFLNAKKAIALARLSGKDQNFTGEHFLARGYAVSTVGFKVEQVRQYIREQEGAFEPWTKARLAQCLNHRSDRLGGGPTHQAIRFGGLVHLQACLAREVRVLGGLWPLQGAISEGVQAIQCGFSKEAWYDTQARHR